MSTIEDFQSATFAALPHEDLTIAATPHEDLTVGEAWASSPLGDPSIEDGFLSEPADLEDFDDFPATTVTALPRSRATTVLVAAAVVAGLGVVGGLGVMLLAGTGSKQEKPS